MIVLIFFIISCESETHVPHQIEKSEKRILNSFVEQLKQRYKSGLEALEKYKTDGSDKKVLLSIIKQLGDGIEGSRKANLGQSLPELNERYHTDLSFQFAEVALKRGDFGDADQIYRGLIKFYVGLAYAGIRDSAKIGVEDVREAKTRISNNTKSNTRFSGEVQIYRSVTGDKGKYYLLKVVQNGKVFETLHKRIGPTYIGYTKCEINAETRMIRNMGYSEESILKLKINPTKWYHLVPGSSKSDLVNFVLSKYNK